MDWFYIVIFVLVLLIFIQPALAMRQLRWARSAKIRELERDLEARVITLIHRQERVSVFGFTSARFIDIDDAQAIIHAIRTTPDHQPIALVLHTPGGLVLAAMQIARAVKAHKGKVSVYVPVYAMSGGTLIALAADEIVMGDFSVLGPIDPQIAGLPAPSIVNVTHQKPLTHVHDLTLVLADIGAKAIAQLRSGATDLMRERLGEAQAQAIAERLTAGHWTHDYAITPEEAREIGLTISTELPEAVTDLMTLYPQPVRQTESVEASPPRDVKRGPESLVWQDWLR